MSEEETFKFSHDSGFKNMVLDFPEPTVRAILPELEEHYGKIKSVAFPREEMNKQGLKDPGRILDIPLKVTFEKGECLLVLIEHKGDKPTFSIYKLAHYTIDLMEMFPGLEIVPVVIFADEAKWRKDVVRELKLKTLGQTWFYFTYRKMKLKDIKAASVSESDNPVWHILTPLLDYPPEERLEWIINAYSKLFRLASPPLFLKYLDYIDKYGKIKKAERENFLKILENKKEGRPMIREWLTEEAEKKVAEEGKKEGMKEGKKEARIEIARGMIREGFDLALITKITGLSKSDLGKTTSNQA